MSSAKYRIIGKLGAGNSTTGVYLAEHLDLGREVAVKLLDLNNGLNRLELLREAKSMASLPAHAHVVQVLDAGDWDADHVYIASEAYLDGTLDTVNPVGEGLDPATACRFVSDACRGLDHMHRHGLIHLDVRPANIFLDKGCPRIGDFGLSRWTTSPATSMVYAPHASPELYTTRTGTPLSDQYAMAMTLAHLLTGGLICALRPPSIPNASAAKTWPPMHAIGDNVPTKLKKVIARATLCDPAERYGTIEEFKRAIDAATPAISFRNVDQVTMESTDRVWRTQWDVTPDGHCITVTKNGRRDTKRSTTGLSERQVHGHVRRLITDWAK